MLKVDSRSESAPFGESEAVYLEVRKAEGRLLPPDVLRELPRVPADNPHVHEWKVRAATTDRLIKHLSRRDRPLQILDLGCGPCWMAARLARALEATVVGVDSNRSELERGAEAFQGVKGLRLIYGDIFEPIVEKASFEAIIVASVLQYFPDPSKLIKRLLHLLKPHGEILVADSPFYKPTEISAAAERTRNYYIKIGFPQMAEYYHHHTLEDLAPFNPVFLYNPDTMLSLISRKVFRRPLSPFPALVIKHSGLP